MANQVAEISPWIPVLTDAVKIMGGAAVAAVGGLITLMLTNRGKLKDSVVNERRTELRKAAIEIAAVHATFCHLGAAIGVHLTRKNDPPEMVAKWSAKIETLSEQTAPAVMKLYEIEARMLLFECHEVAIKVQDFRLSCRLDGLESASKHHEKFLDQIGNSRIAALHSIAQAYKKT